MVGFVGGVGVVGRVVGRVVDVGIVRVCVVVVAVAVVAAAAVGDVVLVMLWCW